MVTISARHFRTCGTADEIGFLRIHLTDRSPNAITRTWILSLRKGDGLWTGTHWWEQVPAGMSHYSGRLPRKLTDALIAAAIRDGAITITRTPT
ncbi:MAG: hypothetical protein J0I99_00515 [Devosia sp.]|uniref:hypothetical protein n=1 Tax=Devosia sp. TaxID=1871048 RepID=UPI001AC11601|nr:hypothetical protein [Devosia sp.]MBN9310846.1 hypothetical protein [Devosia sp.]MBN9314199.1 hypothetical protein [Devosia sp.]